MQDLVFYAIIYIAAIIPMFKLLPHFGFNALWGVLAIIPVGLVVLLWIMAMRVDQRDA
ncbi:MAG: hypothetical protein HRU32_15160 [Rhodobacteraceae bacterium]|nr:hypothetical protein [Paracoccaceae bacterium]